jgi:hypothetical protein
MDGQVWTDAIGYRIAYGQAAAWAKTQRFDHGWGRAFASHAPVLVPSQVLRREPEEPREAALAVAGVPALSRPILGSSWGSDSRRTKTVELPHSISQTSGTAKFWALKSFSWAGKGA